MTPLEELIKFEAFSQLDEVSRTALARELIGKRIARTSAVLHKGQAVSGAYVVLEGRLRVFTMTQEGTEATLYFVNPGDTCVLALNCLFNDLLYPAWVQAEEMCRVAIIPGAVFKLLFEKEPSIRNLTVQTLSTLVWRLMSELEQMHACTHRQRLAQFVLQHASSDGVLLMTQQQLAGHLGTTREVIARLVRKLVTQGLLKTRRGRIEIINLFGLQRITEVVQSV